MPIVQINADKYDSSLLSNEAKELLYQLFQMDAEISHLKIDLANLKRARKKLSIATCEAMSSALISE